MSSSQPATLASEGEGVLQALILDSDLERLEDLLAEFNLFDVLGIARGEPQHSAFLAWLLSPRGSHGLRDYFLRRFLSEAVAEGQIADITPLDVDGWKLTNIEVATERHKIDILLVDETDGFVCLVENKIGAGEQSDQLGRYLRTVESEYEGLIPLPIFLTPEGREPDEEEDAERWVPFDYGKVAALIERTLETRGSTISASVHSFLNQYKGALGRHVLDTADNIDELALQIYNNHRVAIDIIINAKTAPGAMGWDVIEPAIERYAPDLQYNYHNKIVRQFWSTSLDEVSELRPGRVVTFDFLYKEDMTLYAYVQPGPQDTRERLRQLVLKSGKPFHVTKKWGKKWSRIYRKPILSRQDYKPFDADKAKTKVEQAIADFYKNDYWRLVNSIRGEFGLPPASPPAPSPVS